MALSKINRLHTRQDFQAVFREGIRRKSSHLTLRALRSKPNAPGQDVSTATQPGVIHPISVRIGISVSTKVSKRAVIRNRIKRQIRAIFRCLLPQLSSGWRLVVIVHPSAAQECDYQQFLQELKQLLAEAEVFNGYS